MLNADIINQKGKLTDKENARMQLMELMQQEVDDIKSQNLPIIKAFESIAKKSGLKVNTVRNYYYRYINEQTEKRKQDNEDQGRKRHNTFVGKPFTKDEVDNLIIAMLKAQGEGRSVRSCANALSSGNAKLLIRYQNKYRNVVASKPAYVKKLMSNMASQKMTFYDPYTKDYIVNGKLGNTKEYNAEENIVNIFGEIALNIGELENIPMGQFFKGVRDLMKMLVNRVKVSSSDTLTDSIQMDDIPMQEEPMLQELNSKVSMYKSRLEEEIYKNNRLNTLVKQIWTINRNFLGLSEVNRMSELDNYILAIKDCTENYKGIVGE